MYVSCVQLADKYLLAINIAGGHRRPLCDSQKDILDAISSLAYRSVITDTYVVASMAVYHRKYECREKVFMRSWTTQPSSSRRVISISPSAATTR